MSFKVLLGNRMSAGHNFNAELDGDHLEKLFQKRARRVSDKEAGCQMNDLCAVFLHFIRGIFDVSSRATAAGCKTNDLHFSVRIGFK